LAIQLEEALGTQGGFPQQMMHVEVLPALRLQLRSHFLEILRARERSQNRESRLVQLEPLDALPEPLEVFLTPVGIDDEIPCDAVSEAAGDVDAFSGLGDGRILHQALEALVG